MRSIEDYEEGTIGYQIEDIRRRGLALADEIENPIVKEIVREAVNRDVDSMWKLLDDARDASLREMGFIP